MRKYDSYKDSGIDWIGNIPTNWTTSKLKYHTKKIIDGAHFTPTYIEKGYGAIPFLRVTDLHNKEIDTQNIKYIPREEHEELIKRCHPQKGDLLLSKNGTIGLMKIIDWDWEFSIFVSLCLIKFETELINSFFFYFFESNIVDRQLFESSQKTSVTNLHLEKIKELRLTLPPVEEQTQIANYLDQKTTQIDDLISKKEKLIQLLEEERIAIINQAVTKGLNPEAPMKDSGIEWLGDIPEHWEVWKISHAFKKLGSGTTPESGNPKYHSDGTINWLNTGDLNNGVLESCSKKITVDALEDYSSLKVYPAGSLVIAMYGATIGKTAIVNFETTTNQACCVFTDSDIIDIKFLQYWFTAKKEHIINLSVGGGQPNISQQILRNVRLGAPSFDEQLEIVEYLKDKESKFINLKNKLMNEIELLKEYKTALISEVVTGKVDVRNYKTEN